MKSDRFPLSELFHENTKMRRHNREAGMRISMINQNLALQKQLRHCFKRYEGLKTIDLPSDLPKSDLNFEKIVNKRRSTREFSKDPVNLNEVAKLIQCGNGITGRLEDEEGNLLRYLRAAPSGGSLYPVETYFICFNVKELENGVYHYYPKEDQLELLKKGSFRKKFSDPPYQKKIFGKAAGVIVLTAVFERTKFKYGDRGYRYILLEAGHIAQNVMLAATAIDLGSVPICGFVDDEVDQLLDVDGFDESTIYMVAFGNFTDGLGR